jgi:hypothetical protein
MLSDLVGKKLVRIRPSKGDEGAILVFEDGSELDMGWSGGEGVAYLNHREIYTGDWDEVCDHHRTRSYTAGDHYLQCELCGFVCFARDGRWRNP